MSEFPGAPLPVLPPGVLYLIDSLREEDDIREVARIVERLPSVAARVLSLANSSWSAPAGPVMSLVQACARLGFGVVRSVSIASAVSSPFEPARCPGFNGKRFWVSTMLNSEAATSIAEAMPVNLAPESQTARTAGLLRNLSMLWLADRMPQQTDRAFRHLASDGSLPVDAAIQSSCGISRAEVGRRLAVAWGLPEPFITVMARQDAPDHEAAGRVAAVTRAAEAMTADLSRELPRSRELLLYAPLGLTPERTQSIYLSMRSRISHIRDMAIAVFPA